jgi:N-acetylglucosaminyl-diphospho-decaprenol L-rhamnosyltransferase
VNEVALVFVSTGEGRVLLDALASLFDSRPRRDLEVVVVDNASSDGAREVIRRRWPEVAVLVQERRRGLPANLNRGIRETGAPYVMLCNPDLIFRAGAIDTLADFLDAHPGAGIAAPQLFSPEGERRPSARRWYTLRSLVALKWPRSPARPPFPSVAHSVYADWDYETARPVDWVPCPATMVRREALDEVGLMDERFHPLYFDDVDLSLRMHQGGWEVWCVPDAEVVHLEERASVRLFSRAWRWHLVSLLKFCWKHRGLRPRGPSTAAKERSPRWT